MSFTDDLLQRAQAHAINNRAEVAGSELCGCFYCGATFRPSAIQRWLVEAAGTALCAECQIDTVIGDASGLPVSDPAFLQAMHDRWFGEVTS